MGISIVEFYHNGIKKSWKTAFYTAFVACLLIHIYKFTNTLPNHDAVYNEYTNQDITESGRWFLQLACGISSYFDLPWINGLLCAVYLGLTAAMVTELYDMKNPIVIGLSAIILAACPSTTETLFFGFTADGYLLGLMLSATAALLSCKASRWYKNILAGICLCLSCAIYQAYVSFSAVLCICYLIKTLLEYQISIKNAWRWALRHVVLYAFSLGSYYVIWKVILKVTGRFATGYQGINEVGKINGAMIVGGAVASVRNLLLLFLEWNILEHPASLYAVLNILFVAALIYVLAAAVVKSKLYTRPGAMWLVVLALAASIPVTSIWAFASEGVFYRPMMLHSAVVFYIFSLILFDRWVTPKVSTLYAFMMVVMLINFAVMANISYFYLDKCYERSYYIGSRMMEKIEEIQQEDDSVSGIAFVGDRAHDVVVDNVLPGSRIHMLATCLEEDLLYDHTHTYLYLKNVFGLDIPKLPESQIKELEKSYTVQEMGIWPAIDSAQVVGSTLVIKLEGVS